MAGEIINGKLLAAQIKDQLAQEIQHLTAQGLQPGLAVVLVGENPASQVYVRNKARECEKIGMHSEVIRLPEQTTQQELLETIDRLNRDVRIHGILVQLPLPAHIDEVPVINAIAANKDVDGFHPVNVGNLVIGDDCFVPCTPAGVIEMIKRTGIDISGKHAVVVGRSKIVGKPVSLLLLSENATVTICHSKTPNIEQITSQADILVVAAGRPNMIKRNHVKPGAVVIDVGINRLDSGSLVGDVDFEDVKEVAGYITPVPGGVGPMTIAMLLKNTLQSAKKALAVSQP
jgi:methylenetetrahydrofolate dehydrogenase (NADP+)/methenyltetrahydrofolate cyclohydrolase